MVNDVSFRRGGCCYIDIQFSIYNGVQFHTFFFSFFFFFFFFYLFTFFGSFFLGLVDRPEFPPLFGPARKARLTSLLSNLDTLLYHFFLVLGRGVSGGKLVEFLVDANPGIGCISALLPPCASTLIGRVTARQHQT